MTLVFPFFLTDCHKYVQNLCGDQTPALMTEKWDIERMVIQMGNYLHNIKVTNDHRHRGYLEGEIDGMTWFAIVHEEPVETGIDPVSLKRGMGRVTRLCIYQDSSSVDGNPYLPSMSIKRIVYVNYQREWNIFNYDFKSMTHELVGYLERRCCMHLVKPKDETD